DDGAPRSGVLRMGLPDDYRCVDDVCLPTATLMPTPPRDLPVTVAARAASKWQMTARAPSAKRKDPDVTEGHPRGKRLCRAPIRGRARKRGRSREVGCNTASLVPPEVGRVRFDAGKAIWLWGMAVPGLAVGIRAATPERVIVSLVIAFVTLCMG